MIPPLFSHKRFVRSALDYSRRHGGLRTDHQHYHVWQKLKVTNLDHAYPLLATLYSDRLGCLGRDPVSMLRSCLPMILCGVTSFTIWVGMMRDERFYALISGFHPDDTPGVGGFYGFQDRLLQRPCRPHTTTRRPYQSRDQRDKAQKHKNKNDLCSHKDIVNRLADRILARFFPNIPLAAILKGYGNSSALPAHERILHCFFFTGFVARSVDLNLIDLDNLHVAGDGTKLPTWANPRGNELCDCDNKSKKAGEHRCCLRAYHDAHALRAGTATASAGFTVTASTNSAPTACAIAVNCPSSFVWPIATATTASTVLPLSIKPVKPSAYSSRPPPWMQPTMPLGSITQLNSP